MNQEKKGHRVVVIVRPRPRRVWVAVVSGNAVARHGPSSTKSKEGPQPTCWRPTTPTTGDSPPLLLLPSSIHQYQINQNYGSSPFPLHFAGPLRLLPPRFFLLLFFFFFFFFPSSVFPSLSQPVSAPSPRIWQPMNGSMILARVNPRLPRARPPPRRTPPPPPCPSTCRAP